MPRRRKSGQNENLSRACTLRHCPSAAESDSDIEILEHAPTLPVTEDSDTEVTQWTGGVNHSLDTKRSDSDFIWEEIEGLGGLEESSDEDDKERLRLCEEHELRLLKQLTSWDRIMKPCTEKEWKQAESKHGLGYNGLSNRRQRELRQKAREKEKVDEKLRKTPGAALMRNFLAPKSKTGQYTGIREPLSLSIESEVQTNVVQATLAGSSTSHSCAAPTENEGLMPDIFTGYLSDLFDNEPQLEDEGNINEDEPDDAGLQIAGDTDLEPPFFRVHQPPPLKRRRLDVPYRTARKKKREERRAVLRSGLFDIEKLIASKKTKFDAGETGLQARRARAIQSHLHMVVRNGRGGIDASERAAEAQGFSGKWGARHVRSWVEDWLVSRTLPGSERGSHVKSFSLLEDPVICAELRSYLRSNKWSMNPAKLVEFSKKKMVPAAAEKYLCHLVDDEMPRALQRYVEVELFPRIQQKVVKGVTLETARQFLHKEGFRYVEHKKGLYYDGHERPDVVDYRQNEFIPQLLAYRDRLVEYQPENLEEEVVKIPPNYVERRLVLVPQDEMTAQANDSLKKSWVPKGEQPLKKKGVGRGIHQSDVICATHGWMKEASETLEYGKNHDGYWNGEMFVKQLRDKIIPAFEKAHGPGYQALILVDNSQGHCAYAEDALVVSRMNFRPGGKQARLCDDWFNDGDMKVVQKMIFPPDHPEFLNQPKGMKQVLVERGLWENRLHMQCKACPEDALDCCAKRILERQPDFKNQKSLVQEVIEEAGHICLVLPKFHCELNFIEYFWGLVKRYLRVNCDYTFSTLQRNMPLALASVNKILIWKWQNRMIQWTEAYRDGLAVKEAQMRVQAFSSKKYTSHRRIPDRIAAAFD